MHEFVTDIKGDFAKRWATTNRIPEKITVCVGAQVLCTRNFPDLGLANGSRGIITAVDASGVYFKKLSGNIVRVNIFEVPFDSKLNAVHYLPIKLAWAITIHTAQGMTIDALEVDLGTDIFAFGQVSQVGRWYLVTVLTMSLAGLHGTVTRDQSLERSSGQRDPRVVRDEPEGSRVL